MTAGLYINAVWQAPAAGGTFSVVGADTPEEVITLGDARCSSRVVKERVGIVAAIIPRNYPMLMIGRELG